MFVNVILDHEVPVFDEKFANFSARILRLFLRSSHLSGGQCNSGGYRISGMSEPPRQDKTSVQSAVNPPGSSPAAAKSDAMFASKPPEGGGIPPMAWGAAGLAVLVVIVVLVLAGRHKSATPTTIQPLAPYAANLPISQLAMSESTSLSGGKSTFVDGHIKNTGNQTVTGITVQVLFRNNEAMPPQIETMPLSLIRTREPYIDTQPVSAAPLKPGDERDFRL